MPFTQQNCVEKEKTKTKPKHNPHDIIKACYQTQSLCHSHGHHLQALSYHSSPSYTFTSQATTGTTIKVNKQHTRSAG